MKTRISASSVIARYGNRAPSTSLPAIPLCARSAGSVAHRTSPAVGNYDGILLASLYDVKGDRDAAIKLLEAIYAGVRKYTDLELL